MPDFVTVKDFDPSEYPSSVGTDLDRKHYLEWWSIHYLINAIQCIKTGNLKEARACENSARWNLDSLVSLK